MTFARAWEDAPSGIYFDRQFDWPTGEAVWIDLPLWPLKLIWVLAGLCALTSHHLWVSGTENTRSAPPSESPRDAAWQLGRWDGAPQVLLTVLWAIFSLAWFGVELKQSADGLP